MDPLSVVGSFGKLVYSGLVDLGPIRCSKALADKVLYVIKTVDGPTLLKVDMARNTLSWRGNIYKNETGVGLRQIRLAGDPEGASHSISAWPSRPMPIANWMAAELSAT